LKQVVLCDVSGFCFGVKKAVSAVESAIDKYGSAVPIYTFGQIVHNYDVVKNLSKKGINAINSISDIKPGCLVIRSHGASPEIFEEAKSVGFEIVDATCPFVKKIHHIVTDLKLKNIPVIIIGKSEHPEVIGISGYCGSDFYIINSKEDVDYLPSLKTVGIVVQTTKTMEEFNLISKAITEKVSDTVIYNTICFETIRRQTAVANLASQSDLMIISGGKHSSNTSKLFSIASSFCKNTYMVENASEFNPVWLEGNEKIGLACGASTPIEELEKIKDMICTNTK